MSNTFSCKLLVDNFLFNVYQFSCLFIGYEPADLTVHPPPELPRVGSFFSYIYLVFSKNVLKGNPEYFGVIEVQRPKNVVFQHIHSNQILKNLTLFDNIE